jgi:serine phosphatase RsbU (regulator of sigma subunit)
MANLQASLRSRSPQDMQDLARQLRSMNQLLDRCSEANRYATLFLGVYDDSSRRLRYANCGHTPPVLLRKGGAVERLMPTAPVLGLLPEWDCTTEDVVLHDGDLLAVFSDGVTEAFSDRDEEFGDERLVAALRSRGHLSIPEVLDGVVSEVREFSGSEQEDDLTLVVARARS